MAKKAGTLNFSEAEADALRALLERGASVSEASRELGRSYWTVRRHSKKLGLVFRAPAPKPRMSRPASAPGAAERRARLRQLEDWLIRELAAKGWSSGMAAIELDLDQSVLWRHSKRLGVTWTRYGARSVRGEPAPHAKDLRRLRARVRRDLGRPPG
jgi:transcriptional regulator of acetoin/glycerol metabolism